MNKQFIYWLVGFLFLWGNYKICHYALIPEISVIMPTYDHAEFLPKSIESILQQNFPNFELIIVNDGAADNTKQLLESYARTDKRVKIITHSEHRGLSESLNAGIKAAKGRYLAFMADNETAYFNRFDLQLKYLEDYPETNGISFFALAKAGKADDELPAGHDFEKNKLLFYCGYAPFVYSTLMIHSDFIDDNGIRFHSEDDNVAEMTFYRDILEAGGKIATMPEPLQQISPQNAEKQVEAVHQLVAETLQRFDNSPSEEPLTFCACLDKVAQYNAVKSFADEKALFALRQQKCCVPQNGNYIDVEHPEWKDKVCVYEHKIRRREGQWADILYQDDTTLALKWENYKIEVFRKDNQGRWELLVKK